MTPLHHFDSQVAPLFKLTMLEKLSLSWLDPELPVGPVARPIATNLKALILRENCMKEDALGTVLRGAPYLEKLECDLTYDYELDQRCSCTDLATALNQVAATLKTLMIRVRVTWRGIGDFDHAGNLIVGTLGSISHYKKLQSVLPSAIQ